MCGFPWVDLGVLQQTQIRQRCARLCPVVAKYRDLETRDLGLSLCSYVEFAFVNILEVTLLTELIAFLLPFLRLLTKHSFSSCLDETLGDQSSDFYFILPARPR